MRRIAAICAALVIGAGVAACGGSGVHQGVVIGFHFYPAHEDTGFFPMYSEDCFSVGNSESCIPFLVGMFPYTDSYPNEWTVTLLRCWPKPAHCATGDVQVTQRQYSMLKIGDYLGPPITPNFHGAHKPHIKRVTGKNPKH